MGYVEECMKVVQRVTDDGAFDEIRKKVLEELKVNEELKAFVREQVESSKTLGGESTRTSRDRKKILEELIKELHDRLVEKASRTVWSMLNSEGGSVAKDVETKVHEALCKIHDEQHGKQPVAGTSGRQTINPGPAAPGQAGRAPQAPAAGPNAPQAATAAAQAAPSVAGRPGPQQGVQLRNPVLPG